MHAVVTAPAPPVEAHDVRFRVEAATLLDGVGLRAGRGELVGIIGPNGAGKTTLLRALAGMVRPQEGAALLEGVCVRDMPPRDVAAVMAMVPQSPPVTPGFTALELTLMGRYPHLGRFQVEGGDDARIARDALAMTGAAHLADRILDTLSGGERQRVMVARALAQQPRVLLLDEPTANLDVLHQMKTLELVRRMTDSGLTAVAAVHDLTLAARYCDRLLLLCGGRVLAEGAPEEVLTAETLAAAFGVRAAVYRDPAVGALAITVVGPLDSDNSSSPSRV